MARVFRLLLACIVMLAVPLQGFAATTMLLCGGGTGHHGLARTVTEGTLGYLAAASGGHDHSKHDHSAHERASLNATAGDAGEPEARAHVDVAHKCGACASCCHLVAISVSTQPVSPSQLPQSDLTEPTVLLSSLPANVPDKPPRA